jgi:CHAT domain-containing protein/tetratricopeptide (TPR) repeat protein
MAIVLLVGLGFAALRSNSVLWTSAVFMLTVTVLLAVILGAMALRGRAEIGRLNRRVRRLYQLGHYQQALDLAAQACDMARQHLRDDHPGLAISLNNLAELHRAMGDYTAAEPLFRQAGDILRSALGEGHPDYAQSLNNLASLYLTMGNYTAAEPLFRQAGEIRRVALGEGHPDYAQSLNNLASLYLTMGNYTAAEPLFRQAGDIVRSALGEGHPHYAQSLNNLAGVYMEMGNYADAEPPFRQAGEIRRVALGEGHPDYSETLNNLAGVHLAMGNYADAEPLFRQAGDIVRSALGEGHPHYAQSLNNLAGVYLEMGNYADAELLFWQAGDIVRSALGEGHPDYAQSLNNLAGVYAQTDRVPEALALMRRAAAISDRMIGHISSIGSEAQRMAYLKKIQFQMERLLSLVWQHLREVPDAVGVALDLVLGRKAVGAEALATQRDAVLGGKYPALKAQLRELTILRSQIAQKMLAGPGPEGPSAHRQLLAQWDRQKERLEAELARCIPEMNLEQKLRAADRRAVAMALPAGMTLVEFVRFRVFDFQAVRVRGESHWKSALYLAFVLPAGEPDHVQMIDIGEAEPIDRAIADFRARITGEVEKRGGRELIAVPAEPGRVPGNNEDGLLREVIFDKLACTLAGCKRLLLAADGDLTRLPFEVLPTADGHCLIDEYVISYLSCGRDVLRFGTKSSGRPSTSVVLGDPDFDLGAGTIVVPHDPTQDPSRFGSPPIGPAPQSPSSRQSRDLDRRHLSFARLPGTRVEGEHIAAMLGVQPWLDVAALEGHLKTRRSPRILHLATHGFFLADQQRDANIESRDLGVLGSARGSELGRLSGVSLENPMLRSGLALAGANNWLRGGNLPVEAEDGLLTAEDVSSLDLLDTELVVLSACETGLGEIHVGEGVFGLRRAFVLAGAKTLVMSLWKVPDQQTQELMEDFYGRILAGQGCADALREAQLALKARYPDPLHWGAFICQGDRGPLPAGPETVS